MTPSDLFGRGLAIDALEAAPLIVALIVGLIVSLRTWSVRPDASRRLFIVGLIMLAVCSPWAKVGVVWMLMGEFPASMVHGESVQGLETLNSSNLFESTLLALGWSVAIWSQLVADKPEKYLVEETTSSTETVLFSPEGSQREQYLVEDASPKDRPQTAEQSNRIGGDDG